MDPVRAVLDAGGTARRRDLPAAVSDYALAAAVAAGRLERPARGLYTVPGARPSLITARTLRGTMSHSSAAQWCALDLLRDPVDHHVTVPRNARRHPAAGVRLHYADLRPDEVDDDGVTSLVRTVIDCARTLPTAEALTIGDSALRKFLVTPGELAAATARLRGPGASRAARLVSALDDRSASPLESALRAILVDGAVSGFTPQVQVRDGRRLIAQVDLGDPRRRIALEADSFGWHGKRAALVQDCRRYSDLVSRGWLVLRFAWEQVLSEPVWVLDAVRRTVALR